MIWTSLRRLIAVSLLLLGAAFLLYRKTTRLWWTYDSPWLLHIAVGRQWYEAFTVADTRQNLFTPLLTITNELLLALFGFEPSRWYLAQILLIAATATALYAALRLYVPTTAAVTSALLFLLGPPVASVATTLYVIHYFEAMFLGAIATLLFVRALRQERLSIASAAFYLAAMCAKEVAVPLPLFLLVLPDANARTKMRHLVPHTVALTLYAVWRLSIVSLSGYGWTLTAHGVITLPWRLLLAAAGAAPVLGMAIIAAVLLALRTRRAFAIALVGLLCAAGPIVPVSSEMQDRFALLPWLWLSCVFAFTKWRSVAIAVLVLALVANRQEWTAEFTLAKRMSDEAHVWVHERGDVLLRNPAIPPGTMPELEWLKEEQFGHAKGARWFYDDLYLCLRPAQGRRILEYDVTSRRVEEVKATCPRTRDDVPLTAAFDYERGILHWRFGPYGDGTWRVILVDGEHAWDVPRASAYRLGTTRQLALRVGYRAPAGWVTYSPEIALDFTRQTKVTWRR